LRSRKEKRNQKKVVSPFRKAFRLLSFPTEKVSDGICRIRESLQSRLKPSKPNVTWRCAPNFYFSVQFEAESIAVAAEINENSSGQQCKLDIHCIAISPLNWLFRYFDFAAFFYAFMSTLSI